MKETLKQLIKYAIVGLSGFVLEYGIFSLLFYLMGERVLAFLSLEIKSVSIAHTTAYLCGAVWTFVINKLWSFKARSKTLPQSLKYAALLAFNLLVTNYLLVLLVDNTILSAQIAKLLVMALVAFWNFFISKFVIYK